MYLVCANAIAAFEIACICLLSCTTDFVSTTDHAVSKHDQREN